MSDTPETDALYFKGGTTMYDIAGLAKKLERERDEARFDLSFRRELYTVQAIQLAKARKTILELQHKTL